ncbi:hypothetical protein Lal_00044689 [Lupinus albus]|nr:hypothetical protein Lal_00044689 [Lupinus albus]
MITTNQILIISITELEQTHLYVLHNADEVEPYVERHNEMLRNSNPEKQDDQSKMQNSGLTIVARTLHMSSVKDIKSI